MSSPGPALRLCYDPRVVASEDPAQLPDGELARRVAAGGALGAESEDELCRRYLNRARLYGLRHLRFDVTAAEDLAQQVMVGVLEALRAGRVQDPDRVDRFMLGTCRNVALEMHRAERRLGETRERLAREGVPAVTPPWQLVEAPAVERCLSRLPERDAHLLMLLFQQEASAAQAAEALGTTPGNVRVLRHRAIARLRACVEGGAS